MIAAIQQYPLISIAAAFVAGIWLGMAALSIFVVGGRSDPK